MKNKKPLTNLIIIVLLLLPSHEAKKCRKRCDLALASYYVIPGSNLTTISTLFAKNFTEILEFNPHVKSKDQIISGTRLNLPFACDCMKRSGGLGHTFTYTTQVGDTYDKIANAYFAGLTNVEFLEQENGYDPTRIPDHVNVKVTVNCTCGDPHVSKKYGLFVTYPLRVGDGLTRVARDAGVPEWVVRKYNPGVDFGSGTGVAFLPAKNQNGTFPPLGSIKSEFLGRVVAGIAVAGVSIALLFTLGLYICRRRKFDETEAPMLQELSAKKSKSQRPGHSNVKVNTTVPEFPYEELQEATNQFSMSRMIGQGGYGYVYYGELRGQKVAIKKMRSGGSESFLAELKVLANVQHNNLVRLMGYTIHRSLLLVYEFMENGSLDQHLRGSGKDTLPWVTRVQIALDCARALEYIHEHTVPLYIHRDIKSANILLDKSFHAKVADFGLAKLTGFGSDESCTSKAKGTLGYMPTEYLQHGALSTKIDVYAFGVVLFELISAKCPIITIDGTSERQRLIDMFDEILRNPGRVDDLRKIVDPRLGDDYSLESVNKMALLARKCIHEDPTLRPSMRAIVVALNMLSSATEEWDIGLCVDT